MQAFNCVLYTRLTAWQTLFPSPIFPPVKRELAYMHLQNILNLIHLYANPSGCVVWPRGLRRGYVAIHLLGLWV